MKRLISFFVNNTILVNFICVLTLMLGILATFQIQKEAMPPVELDKMLIITSYPGASAIDIENLVTIPIEEKVANIANIEKVDSTSSSGVSRLLIDIDPDYQNTSEVVDEVYRSVNEVNDLPEESNDPRTIQFRARRRPIMRMAIYGGEDDKQLHQWANKLKDHLSTVEGVSSIDLRGDKSLAFRIEVNPKLLERYSLSLQEIINTTVKWNKSAPAGSIKINHKEIKVRIDESLNTVAKIENLVIRTNVSGKAVKIKDVANVSEGFEQTKRIFSYNGKKMIGVRVVRKESGDTIKTTYGILDALKKFKTKMPKSISVDIYRNDANYIRSRLNAVSQNALLGLFFVVLTLLVFLNVRMALITAFGLPIAFFGSVYILQLMGLTFNNITLIGIIIVLGMLVDDGIVVAENIYYHLQKKKEESKRAIINATLEMSRPVVGTILTTIAAFAPLLFMSGIIGKFMYLLPVTVITCLVFSLIECFLILPNHALDFMKDTKYRLGEIASDKLEKMYMPILGFSIRYRWYVVPIILVLALSFSAYYLMTFKMRMFSSRGVSRFNFSIEGPVTATLSQTYSMIKIAGKSIDELKPMGIVGYMTSVGEISRRGEIPREGDYLADFTVYLEYESKLKENPRDILQAVRAKVQSQLPSTWKSNFEIRRHGPPLGKPVEVIVGHDNFKQLKTISAEVKQIVSNVEGVTDVTDIFDEKYREYIININQKEALKFGVELSSLQKIILAAFEETSATEVRKDGDEYKIIITYPENFRVGMDNLLSLKVSTKYSTYITLKDLISINLNEGVSVVKRIDQKRVSLVSGDLKNRKANSYLINQEILKHLDKLETKYPEAFFKISGEELKRQETMKDTLRLFSISLIIIYMILSIVFSSITWPFLIILIIPFSFAGALSALRLHGVMVDVPVLISLVGLTGIVVNDSIILISTIRNKLKDSLCHLVAVEKGALRRVRPIFMTTVTTLGGLFPAAYEILGKDSLMKPMALTIGWGLAFSTILTLIFLPGLMACLLDGKIKKAT